MPAKPLSFAAATTRIIHITKAIIIMADQKVHSRYFTDLSWKATPYGVGYTGDTDMISEDLARRIYTKSIAFRIECNVVGTK
jgi:hypothetical protein